MVDYDMTLVMLSIVVAVVGSFMALMITRNARKYPSEGRGLVFLAALCLGGVAIWSMHFIGMMAYQVRDMAMGYEGWLTFLSLVIGVGIVYIGLSMVSHDVDDISFGRLIWAGILVGLGVVAMHYTGIFAMRVQADAQWNWSLIATSVAIAIVASVVALWLTMQVQSLWEIAIGAIVMGIAVCGMHYTGMAAVSFARNASLPPIESMSMDIAMFSIIISALDAVIIVLAIVATMNQGE